ncbi:hypothetical protein F511_19752 [Dorcoceras hygrometricum]|uniref:Uncharacterized protein n=1 Tax=Dorcoceras hygrometricum TaxID=472368 RepID=A0A2Z7D9F4_9LAMI|nr:hypothetical protein F511_19752 [Dorcoceras hygrometricum]
MYCAVMGREWNPVEGQFLKMKSLRIADTDLEEWVADSSHFPNLEKLQLSFLRHLKEIPYGIGEIGTLRTISLFDCSSSSNASAEKIQEEQLQLGNSDLQDLYGRGPGFTASERAAKLGTSARYFSETYSHSKGQGLAGAKQLARKKGMKYDLIEYYRGKFDGQTTACCVRFTKETRCSDTTESSNADVEVPQTNQARPQQIGLAIQSNLGGQFENPMNCVPHNKTIRQLRDVSDLQRKPAVVSSSNSACMTNNNDRKEDEAIEDIGQYLLDNFD